MSNRSLIGLLLLFGLASRAAAQQSRTFPEAQCKFTLPSDDWDWLDPQMAPRTNSKCIAFAKNQNGIGFVLRFEPLAGKKPTARSFESYEAGLFETPQLKKLAGKRISFKGISTYQIDAEARGTIGTSIRIFYANDSFFDLSIINSLGRLPTDISDPIFEGFDFTGTPQPVRIPDSADSLAIGIGVLVFVAVAVGVVIFLLRLRRSGPKTDAGR